MKLECEITVGDKRFSGLMTPIEALNIIEKIVEKVNAWQDLKEK